MRNVKIERAGDLIYVTYFMVNWKEEKEGPSDRRCAECGKSMGRLEATVGEGEMNYEGLVCHNCKRLIWLRNG
jgi:uncharacterized protein with PIN domain